MIRVQFFAAILAVSAAAQTLAADIDAPPDRAFELGIGIGKSSLRVSFPGVEGSATVNATGFKGLLGYRFGKYVTLEAAYIDGGTFTYRADTARIDTHPKIEQLSVVGSYPVFGSLAPYIRLGADHWNSDLTFSDPLLGKASLSGSSTDFAWGAGLEAFIDRSLIRVEYDQMRTSQNVDNVLPTDFRHQLISASIVWLLGF